MRKVHVARHLRRNPLTVSTPHPRQFAPPRPRKAPQTHERRARRPERPKPRKVPVTAFTLDDFDLVADQPRPIRPRGKPEPLIEMGEKMRKESYELDGIANGKELLLLVKHDPRGEIKGKAIFKPAYGEPNWASDFEIPEGQQYVREAVMYQLDKLLGFDLVPPTAIRIVDGNVGSLQEWKEPTKMLYKVEREGGRYNKDDLLKIVALDIISGNIDRHGGNVLVGQGGKLWAIDHGGAFPARRLFGINDPYIREYRGKLIPPAIRKALNDIDEGDLRAALAPLLIGERTGFLALEEAVDRWQHLKEAATFPSSMAAEEWTESAAGRARAKWEERKKIQASQVQKVQPSVPREMVTEIEDRGDEDRPMCSQCGLTLGWDSPTCKSCGHRQGSDD